MQNVISKCISHGTYVVTARADDKINGMTAAWISQVSLRPLLLMVSIAPVRFTHGLIEKARRFALNVLPEDRQDLARHFGFKSGRNTNKFENLAYFEGENGAPILKDAMAYVECDVVSSFSAGDHTIFVGEVSTAKLVQENAEPLIFRWEDYF